MLPTSIFKKIENPREGTYHALASQIAMRSSYSLPTKIPQCCIKETTLILQSNEFLKNNLRLNKRNYIMTQIFS